MRVIEVNKYCEINQDNIAKSVEDRAIAINVIQKVKDEKGFINFCLAIDDYQDCCERWEAIYKKIADYDDNNVFVSKIEAEIDYSEEDVEKYCKEYLTFFDNENNDNDEDDDDEKKADYFHICKVYGENEELIALGIVYNYHNGYYKHYVYENENSKLIYKNRI